ncbi:MAG: pyrimidine dimer DNA glycosylase/endonuclease V [Desulfuromusa sp.]|nr:pyrimidine dimer DNA glycosylase/endonuclease V [Desulfuromusa sp.]
MRIWDINPGYLNRQSLLGEHRELHGIVSIIKNNKKGYSKHPETIRWIGYGWAINQRHRLLSAEMSFRGYQDKSPVNLRSNKDQWPEIYIDSPHIQMKLLKQKYIGKEKGRIPIPKTAQQLWEHHKYSVLARGTSEYKKLEKLISSYSDGKNFSDLHKRLTTILRKRPSTKGINTSLQHMWECASSSYTGNQDNILSWSQGRLLTEIQRLSRSNFDTHLRSCTALSELGTWM